MKDLDEELEDYMLDLLSHWMEVVDALWLLMIVGAIVSAAVPQLSCVGTHGKRTNCDPQSSSLFTRLVVPKRYFCHFYIWGAALTAVLLVWMLLRPYPLQLLTAILFLVHTLRRWWECAYMTEYGTSTMHFAGYLVGMLHYTLVPLTLLIVAGEEKISLTHHSLLLGLRRKDSTRAIVALVIYLGSSALQFSSHRILFHMKRRMAKSDELGATPSGISSYALPSGGGFDFCSCPHYLGEIGIYLAVAVSAAKSRSVYCLLAWVITNLSIVAYKQFSWYVEQYPDEVEKRQWSILFPFLW